MATKRFCAAAHLLILTGLAFSVSGCAYGLLYTSTTTPLVTNMRGAPRGETVADGDTQQVAIPVTPVSLSATWSTRAIGDAAKQAGLREIYYADLHTVSILLGMYETKTVKVYGR